MTTVKIASRQCGKAHALRNESGGLCSGFIHPFLNVFDGLPIDCLIP